MITLRELVENQKWNDATDIQIIRAFFEMNNLEEEGITLISCLTQSKISKIKNKYVMAEEWICMLPSKYLYENYDLDTADHLHMLELNYLINGGRLSKTQLKWSTENVPKIKMPEAYFNPLIEWMEEKDIRFKGE